MAMALCQNGALICFNPSTTTTTTTTTTSQSNLFNKTPSLLPFKRFPPPLPPYSYRMMMPTNTNGIISAAASTSSSSSSPPLQQPPPNLTSILASSTKWSVFAGNLSGEWDGHGADFTLEGNPIELPESVVPEAYREWEVKVFDWQTQCPTLALPDDFSVIYKSIKLLPTVGCEADAATRYTVDERKIGGPDNSVSAFAYKSNGSYVAVWPIKDRLSNDLLELEHCLVDPQDPESRVRIIQVVRVEHRIPVLKSIRVFVEQRYGPFRNGEQLGGCSIRDSAFASTIALNSSDIIGEWEAFGNVANFRNSSKGILQELLDDYVDKSVRDEQNLVLLPKNLWSSVKETEDGETCFEVGWLLQKGRSLTSNCVFSSNAELKEIAMARSTAILDHNDG